MVNLTNDQKLIQAIAEQYGAAMTMLENTIVNCDEELWKDIERDTVISQVVYHTLYFIDIYLSKDREEWETYTGKLGEDGDADTYIHKPEKYFTKQELLNYTHEIRVKANERFKNLSIEELNSKSLFNWHGTSILSSLLYNLRHIMLHVGALHVRLNAVSKEPLKWISKANLL